MKNKIPVSSTKHDVVAPVAIVKYEHIALATDTFGQTLQFLLHLSVAQ